MDNKSGWKTNEKILSKKEPNIYSEIKKFSEKNSLNNLLFKQQVWHFINKYPNIPKCVECGEELKFKRSLNEGYGKYCSLKCTNKNKSHIESSKKTWLTKKDSILEKTKLTNLKKFGVVNTFQNLDLVKNGFIRNHGVDHVSKVVGVSEKRRETFLKKYGYSNNFTNPKIKDKINEGKQNNFLLKNKNFKFKNWVGTNITVECDVCKLDYVINRSLFRHRTLYQKTPCTFCNPINSGDSFFEKEVLDFVKSLYFDDVIENDRSLISPKELDIYLPKIKLAIEFNGLFWHSSDFVNSDYHVNKTNMCNSSGIELIQIFEDEWVYKKEIVKSIIKNKFGVFDRVVYARKCLIKKIDSKSYKDFCNENHIQGSVNSLIKLGLYYNDELLSIMSFGGLRKSLGSNKEIGSYEMLRFCTKLGVSVVGGASKLFNYFIKSYSPNKIISFSDKRYFSGSVYKKLNFKFESNTSPNYFYMKDYLKRENRFKYRKDVLVKEGFDKLKSESEIMKDRGFLKIWDCGNKKWVWDNPNPPSIN
jgi:hypothetical protein